MELDDERRIIIESQTNPEAFGAIFDTYYSKMLAYTVRRTGSVVIAEEIVSEVFIKALKNLSKFQWQGISIEAWLFRITINEIRMHFRGSAPIASLDELYLLEGFEPQADYDVLQEALDAQDQLERHEQFIRARKLIHSLPTKYQDVILLRFIEHKKISEIAHILNKKEGTVKSLLSRGLARLREAISQQDMQPTKDKRIVKDERQQ